MKLIKKIFSVDEYLSGISTVSNEEAKRQQETLQSKKLNDKRKEDEVRAFFNEKAIGYKAKMKS